MKCMHCKSEWNVSHEIAISMMNCPFCGCSLAPPKKEFANIEDVLVEIGKKFGMEVLSDGTKLGPYFADIAPNLSRQRRIVGYFVEHGGPHTIMKV